MATNDQDQTTPELFTDGKFSPHELVPIVDETLLELINAPHLHHNYGKSFENDTNGRLRQLDCLLDWIVPRKSGCARRWSMQSVFGAPPTSISEAEWLVGQRMSWFTLHCLDLFVEITLDEQTLTAHLTSIEQIREIATYRFQHSCSVRFVAPLTHRLMLMA